MAKLRQAISAILCALLLQATVAAQTGLVADFELTFMEMSKVNGVGVPLGGGTANDFGYDATPRATIGIVGSQGSGLRVRYWEYSQTAGPVATATSVDTYNIDAEFFQQIDLSCTSSIEWSAGVRYNDFISSEVAPVIPLTIRDSFAGFGLVVGAEARQTLAVGGAFARARWAVLNDENSRLTIATAPVTGPINDRIATQAELAAGYELSHGTDYGLVTTRVGYEVQYWDNYGPNPSGSGEHGGVGFHGFVLGLALER